MAVAKKAVQNAEKTNQRANDLDAEIKNLLKKIKGNARGDLQKRLHPFYFSLFRYHEDDH